MQRYDPLQSPPPEEWLAMDEDERLILVEAYHRRARVRVPNVRAHAIFHVIVENQVAMGNEIPVSSTLARLMTEGADRHESLHAIASVLSEYVLDIANGNPLPSDPNAAYYAALERLTVESWRQL